jgi:hypothetical protein
MEINPIREIRAPAAAGAVKAESEVQAPHPPMRTDRMEDDGYRGNDQAPGRGLEEEEPEDMPDHESDSENRFDRFA